jgi:hypothetical protein
VVSCQEQSLGGRFWGKPRPTVDCRAHDDTGIRLDGLRNTTKTISQDNRSLDWEVVNGEEIKSPFGNRTSIFQDERPASLQAVSGIICSPIKVDGSVVEECYSTEMFSESWRGWKRLSNVMGLYFWRKCGRPNASVCFGWSVTCKWRY